MLDLLLITVSQAFIYTHIKSTPLKKHSYLYAARTSCYSDISNQVYIMYMHFYKFEIETLPLNFIRLFQLLISKGGDFNGR